MATSWHVRGPRADQGFPFFLGGGGGQDIMCARAHITGAKPVTPLRTGSRACLKGSGSSRL